MGVHVVLMGIDDAHRNVGAVIGGALYVGQQIRPYEACLHTARTLFQPGNVPVAQNGLDVVDDLLQRFHGASSFPIVTAQSIHGKTQDLGQRTAQHFHFFFGALGKVDLLFLAFLRRHDQTEYVQNRVQVQ